MQAWGSLFGPTRNRDTPASGHYYGLTSSSDMDLYSYHVMNDDPRVCDTSNNKRNIGTKLSGLSLSSPAVASFEMMETIGMNLSGVPVDLMRVKEASETFSTDRSGWANTPYL